MLRTEWLDAFTTFAEHLNFTHAARAIHLSQPALFVQIRNLTESVGVTLYRKVGRRLELTDAGVRLLAFARESRERSSEVIEELRTGKTREMLTVAAGSGAYLYILGPALQALARSHTIRLSLLERDRLGSIEA